MRHVLSGKQIQKRRGGSRQLVVVETVIRHALRRDIWVGKLYQSYL